ncbi:YggT family protein [Coriobacterium glomerans]|uniref:YggT family protein n=1 Tax=Coriobacterium glomerans TaxID=33871 RepID=UPI003CCAA447
MSLYTFLILVNSALSWVPLGRLGMMSGIAAAINAICEPFVGLFRRIIPTFGGIDFSPFVAILALMALRRILTAILLPTVY